MIVPTEKAVEANTRAMFAARDKVTARKRDRVEEKILKILKEREESQKPLPTQEGER